RKARGGSLAWSRALPQWSSIHSRWQTVTQPLGPSSSPISGLLAPCASSSRDGGTRHARCRGVTAPRTITTESYVGGGSPCVLRSAHESTQPVIGLRTDERRTPCCSAHATDRPRCQRHAAGPQCISSRYPIS